MTPTPTDAQMKLADVTDADREAAADAMGLTEIHKNQIRAGEYDGNVLVQAFAAHRRATEASAQGLVEALTASALRFREYEASHAAKGNLDGDAKARRNCEMAEQCEQALATWRRT